MKNIKDFIKNLKEEDFDKVNLHIHTSYSDGKSEFKEVVENAKEKGYKLIAITDHNTVKDIRNIKMIFYLPA